MLGFYYIELKSNSENKTAKLGDKVDNALYFRHSMADSNCFSAHANLPIQFQLTQMMRSMKWPRDALPEGNPARRISSQLPVKSWHTYLNDSTMADAVLDRVGHHTTTTISISREGALRDKRDGK